MKAHFDKLKKHKASGDQAAFNALLEQILPKLKLYVKRQIHNYENKGVFKKGFYSPDDIVAEVYLRIYDRFDRITGPDEIKPLLFKTANEVLDELAAKEKKPFKSLPVDRILKEELNMLNERMTATADGEIVLIDDLDDISYKQDEFKKKYFLLDKTAEEAFVRSLGLAPEDFADEKFRSIFGNYYTDLPDTVKRILDLYTFGEMSPSEIALVMEANDKDVQMTLKTVKEHVRKLK